MATYVYDVATTTPREQDRYRFDECTKSKHGIPASAGYEVDKIPSPYKRMRQTLHPRSSTCELNTSVPCENNHTNPIQSNQPRIPLPLSPRISFLHHQSPPSPPFLPTSPSPLLLPIPTPTPFSTANPLPTNPLSTNRPQTPFPYPPFPYLPSQPPLHKTPTNPPSQNPLPTTPSSQQIPSKSPIPISISATPRRPVTAGYGWI